MIRVPCEKCGHPHSTQGIGDGEIAALLAERDNIRYHLRVLLHAYRNGNSISPFREKEMRESVMLKP